MDHDKHIIRYLSDLRFRAYRQTVMQVLSVSTFCVMVFLSLMFIGIRFIHFPFPKTIGISILITGTVGFSIVISYRYRKTLEQIAQKVDEHGLKERVSTALSLIQQNRQDEVALLQIHNTSEYVSTVDQQKIIPFYLPLLLKWIPIPLLLIGLSFAIPLQYALPQPTSVVEQIAINSAIVNLENSIATMNNPILNDEIRSTIRRLKSVKDVPSAQEHLRKLNGLVQQQKSALPDEEKIRQAIQASEHFNGMNTNSLADELETLGSLTELSPELTAEITKLLEKLSKNNPNSPFNSALQQIKTKQVSQETLNQIVKSLRQLDQLNQLEAQLTESRKDIALAGIEIEQMDGGIASSDSAPGNESGNSETQGTLVNSDVPDKSNIDDATISNEGNADSTKPLTGDELDSLSMDGKELRLNSNTVSDIQSSTRVFNGRKENSGSEPAYLPFSEVVLNAQREYAQAIEKKRIPLRYRPQIKAYLEAITKIDEK